MKSEFWIAMIIIILSGIAAWISFLLDGIVLAFIMFWVTLLILALVMWISLEEQDDKQN